MSSQNNDSMWRYGTAPCALGIVAIAATENGIRSIEFGDIAQQLRDDLVAHFPNAQLTSLNGREQNALQQLVELIEHPSGALQLPGARDSMPSRDSWQW